MDFGSTLIVIYLNFPVIQVIDKIENQINLFCITDAFWKKLTLAAEKKVCLFVVIILTYHTNYTLDIIFVILLYY